MTVAIEREIKLGFASVDEARERVIASGATPLRGRRLQEDALLDTPDGSLRRGCCVLRIRTESGKNRITFKGPVQDGLMKVREEIETSVGDADAVLRILAALGFCPWFRYQKYREEYAFEDVIIAIDETPVGVYVELEGGEHGIATMAGVLGRTEADYLRDSYRSLFVRHCHEQGLPPGDMLFDVT